MNIFTLNHTVSDYTAASDATLAIFEVWAQGEDTGVSPTGSDGGAGSGYAAATLTLTPGHTYVKGVDFLIPTDHTPCQWIVGGIGVGTSAGAGGTPGGGTLYNTAGSANVGGDGAAPNAGLSGGGGGASADDFGDGNNASDEFGATANGDGGSGGDGAVTGMSPAANGSTPGGGSGGRFTGDPAVVGGDAQIKISVFLPAPDPPPFLTEIGGANTTRRSFIWTAAPGTDVTYDVQMATSSTGTFISKIGVGGLVGLTGTCGGTAPVNIIVGTPYWVRCAATSDSGGGLTSYSNTLTLTTSATQNINRRATWNPVFPPDGSAPANTTVVTQSNKLWADSATGNMYAGARCDANGTLLTYFGQQVYQQFTVGSGANYFQWKIPTAQMASGGVATDLMITDFSGIGTAVAQHIIFRNTRAAGVLHAAALGVSGNGNLTLSAYAANMRDLNVTLSANVPVRLGLSVSLSATAGKFSSIAWIANATETSFRNIGTMTSDDTFASGLSDVLVGCGVVSGGESRFTAQYQQGYLYWLNNATSFAYDASVPRFSTAPATFCVADTGSASAICSIAAPGTPIAWNTINLCGYVPAAANTGDIIRTLGTINMTDTANPMMLTQSGYRHFPEATLNCLRTLTPTLVGTNNTWSFPSIGLPKAVVFEDGKWPYTVATGSAYTGATLTYVASHTMSQWANGSVVVVHPSDTFKFAYPQQAGKP